MDWVILMASASSDLSVAKRMRRILVQPVLPVLPVRSVSKKQSAVPGNGDGPETSKRKYDPANQAGRRMSSPENKASRSKFETEQVQQTQTPQEQDSRLQVDDQHDIRYELDAASENSTSVSSCSALSGERPSSTCPFSQKILT